MSIQTWFFILLAVMALRRLIRSYSADTLRSSLKPPNRKNPSTKPRGLIVRGCIYIPPGLWAALERADRLGEHWLSLPPGERDADLEGLLEWIANATPGEVLEIVSEIKRHYHNTGDHEGGDALMQALRKSLKATSMAEREAILLRYEPYTRQSRLPSFWIEEA